MPEMTEAELAEGLASVATTTTTSTAECPEPPGAEPQEPPDLPPAEPPAPPAVPLPPVTAAVPVPLPPESSAVPSPTRVLPQIWYHTKVLPPRTRLEVRATITAGNFGVVRLVRDPVTSLRYALKEIRKAHILKCSPKVRCKWILHEREALEELCHHPFIVKLIRTYESTEHVYFLLELLRGGELRGIMQLIGCVSEDTKPQPPADHPQATRPH